MLCRGLELAMGAFLHMDCEKKIVKGRVLILAQEIYPLIAVGGLGKFVAGVSQGLIKNNWEVTVLVPENQKRVYLPCGSPENKTRSQKLVNRAYQWCVANHWWPDWVWVQDWDGAYQAEAWKRKIKTKVIWTIHSPLGLNGAEYGYGYGDNAPGDNKIDWSDDFFEFSALVGRGIKNADLITTVSPSFAKTLAHSRLFATAAVLGIENGIDLTEWDPLTDNNLKEKTDRNWRTFKNVNKEIIQAIFGLPRTNVPVFAFVSRLVSQKGLDLLLATLPLFLAKKAVQFVAVGQGAARYHASLENLKKCFPRKVGLHLKSDFSLPHQVFAGADYLLLPSLAEPYGIVVAEARCYGTIPIVRSVDGLADQVADGHNGLSFLRGHRDDLLGKLDEALSLWHSAKWWTMSEGGKYLVKDWQAIVKKYEPYLFDRLEKRNTPVRRSAQALFFS